MHGSGIERVKGETLLTIHTKNSLAEFLLPTLTVLSSAGLEVLVPKEGTLQPAAFRLIGA